jgi:cyclophilin family peptidyl-prolyl cis-trans isomerase
MTSYFRATGSLRAFWLLLIGLLASTAVGTTSAQAQSQAQSTTRTYTENPRVVIETSVGSIEIELLPKFAPKHVDNFLNLVDKAFYDGLVFHRVIPGFMIQTGGFDADINYREHDEISVPNESFNGLKNRRGSVAAARTDDPDSADTQFFINVVDNPSLDAKRGEPGYTVFGRVIDGFDAVEEIELTDTHLRNGMAGVPEQAITILSVRQR